jgi:hypothetical protein
VPKSIPKKASPLCLTSTQALDPLKIPSNYKINPFNTKITLLIPLQTINQLKKFMLLTPAISKPRTPKKYLNNKTSVLMPLWMKASFPCLNLKINPLLHSIKRLKRKISEKIKEMIHSKNLKMIFK